MSDEGNRNFWIKVLALAALFVIVGMEIIILKERPTPAEITAIVAVAGATAVIDKIGKKK